ncbi:hypothetical protein ACWZQY_023955 [Priestia megaterium]
MSGLNNERCGEDNDLYDAWINSRERIIEGESMHSSLELSQLLNDHGKSEKEMKLLREVCNTHTGDDAHFDLIQSFLRIELDYSGKKTRAGIYKKMERKIDSFLKGDDL